MHLVLPSEQARLQNCEELCIKDLQSDYVPCNIQYISGPPILYNGIITFILAACSNIELSSALTRWIDNILEQYNKVAANWRGLLMWSPFICINEVSTLTSPDVYVWLCEVGTYFSV